MSNWTGTGRICGTEALQAELERHMQEEGRQRYFAAIASAQDRGTEVGTPYGQRLISLHTTRLAIAIQEFIDNAEGKRGRRHACLEYLKQIDSRSAAWITLHAILNVISKPKLRLTALGLTVGRAILVEIEMRNLRKQDKALHAGILKATDLKSQQYRKEVTARFLQEKAGMEPMSASTQACLLLGVKLVELVLEKLGIITYEMTHSIGLKGASRKHERNHLIRPTPELVDWILRGHHVFSELDPVYAPMVVPPVPWSDPLVGGYLTNDLKPLTLVKTKSRRYFKRLSSKPMPLVYESVNRIQATAWRINHRILDVIETLMANNAELGGLPRSELYEVPPKPDDIATNAQARKAYRRAAFQVHQQNVTLTSRRAKVGTILRTASKYAEYEAIYFPHQVDFRGRVYPVTTLSPQGEDFVKALLEFSHGEALGTEVAADWLAIHIANLFGVDKVSFQDRVAWTIAHSDMLLAIAGDPYDNREWCDADSPFQALAAAFEWAGYCRDGLAHVSRIPIALDGSCSGLQQFGMALRCEETGAAVNLVPADKPADIYQAVINRCYVSLVELAGEDWAENSLEAMEYKARRAIEPIYSQSSLNLPIEAWMDQVINAQYDEEGKPLQRRPAEAEAHNLYRDTICAWLWLKFGYNQKTGLMQRKLSKRAVMTFPYSSKEFGFRDQLLEDIVNQNQEAFHGHSWKAAGLLARLLWDAVNKTVVRAAQAMEWLQTVARLVTKAGRNVTWTTPLGFLVEQNYAKTTDALVATTFAGSERIRLTLPADQAQPCSRKNASAVSPNFVHSLDASHLLLTVARAPDIKEWAVIHDSFGTLASRTQSLFMYVRVAFMELYTQHNVLEEFREQMLCDDDTKERIDIPEAPRQGNLDLYAILRSQYCFA